MVLIKDIMKKDVFTIGNEDRVYEAVKQMSTNGVSCLIVLEDSKPVGIVTRRDILEKVVLLKKDVEAELISHVMSSPIYSLGEKATLIAASGLMKNMNLKQIPILESGTLVGIVTMTDVVRNINQMLAFDAE